MSSERSRAIVRDITGALDDVERLDSVLDLFLEDARHIGDVDLSQAPDEVGDALVTRLAERAGFLPSEVRTQMILGLWRWGVSSCCSLQTKRLLLCAIVDETTVGSDTRREAAIMLSLIGDRASLAALLARMHLDVIPVALATTALMAIDPMEAYEELSPRYRSDLTARASIARSLDRRADERWIQEALAIVDEDRATALATLYSIGTQRALAEANQIASPPADDDR